MGADEKSQGLGLMAELRGKVVPLQGRDRIARPVEGKEMACCALLLNHPVVVRQIVRGCLDPMVPITCGEDFIDDTDFVIRKGAIRSYEGEKMIIPFNMRDGSWIVEGKSNPDWNNSAPHGAGRVMSRNQAKRTLKLEDFEEQMKGIYTTSVCRATLDEAPDTYKPAIIIQDAIKDTATIVHNLKPVYNLKSSEEGVFGKKKKFAATGNSPDDVWARVKETLPHELITKDNESEFRVEFERAPRDFCEKYRKDL